MKKKNLILGGLISITTLAGAQTWGGSGTQTGNAYRTGNVGIGTTSPAFQLDVSTGAIDGGAKITQTNYGGALLFLNNATSGGRNWGLLSSGAGNAVSAGHFAIYDITNSINRFFINGSSGNIGVGSTSPLHKLHVETSASNDGIGIIQNGSDASALHLYNNGTGGQHWALFSAGAGNTQGAGNFSIFQYGATDRLFINGTTGNVGIGTISTANGRLVIRQNLPYGTSLSQKNTGIYSDAKSTTWTSGYTTGVWGLAGSLGGIIGQDATNVGVRGEAYEGREAYGGHFYAETGTHALTATGVFAKSISQSGNGYAGHFDGNVIASNYYTISDRKLKDNITPLTSTLDKIALLRPSTYNFRREEFKGMSLPSGKQIGLIAQELEEVFPELIAEVKASIHKNDKGDVIADIKEHKSVNYIGLIPVLIAGIQEQQTLIEAQQKQLDEQKELINNLAQKSSATTGVNDLSVEAGFQMSQNEPNPFTHETVVKYTLPQTISNAFIAVYDLTGKQITTFPITEKGSSSLTITSEKLAAGIYIYSIVADGKVLDSKRMIVAEK